MAERDTVLSFAVGNGDGSRPVPLTPLESVMWRVGQDATLRMTVGVLLLLDRPPDPDALRRRVGTAMAGAARLRQRPEPQPAGRHRPVWVDDGDISPDAHVRCLSMTGAAPQRQLLHLVALLEALPFDPARAPWDLTLIDGLEHGRAAVYVRAHHVLTDGIGGMRLLGLLLDDRDGAAPAPGAEASSREVPASPLGRDHPAGTITLSIDVPKALRRLVHRVGAARDFDPVDSALRGAERALDVANSVSRQLLISGSAFGTPHPRRSLLSDFEVFSVARARSAAVALGGSRNDLLVAAAAAGLGAYLERRGAPTPDVRLVTPTYQRHGEGLGGNWFAPARLTVPTAVGRPGPQFGIIAERLAQARREPALQMASRIATALGRLPSNVLLPALHSQSRSVDFAATALPGLRTERLLCGTVIEGAYPLAPRLGCPLNVTAIGNADRLDIGVALDTEAIPDPDELVECLREAFAGYCAAALGDGSAGAV